MAEEDRIRVGPAAEIAEGTAKVVDAFGRTVAIWRAGGRLYAIDDCCPHRGGSLGAGDLEPGCKVACPLHGWTFELETGCLVGQPNVSVPIYALSEEDGTVYLGRAITRGAHG
jgi:nitrite reductase/ring-hydroxylating ferredoxin subunit